MKESKQDMHKKFGIPHEVKVGGYTVIVDFDDTLIQDHCANGMYIPSAKKILLHPGLCPQQIHSTYCHELIEAITEVYDLQCLREDHHILTLIGEGIYQIFKDSNYSPK